MYKVSEGYNLEDAGKQTYFDKYNVMELLSIGATNRSTERNSPKTINTSTFATTSAGLNNSSSIEALKRYKGTNSSLNIMVQRQA